MSISGLEQRRMPLVMVSSVWSPWGPAKVEREDEESYNIGHDESPPKQRRKQRSLSWGGYSSHTQLKQFSMPSDLEWSDDASESSSEQDVSMRSMPFSKMEYCKRLESVSIPALKSSLMSQDLRHAAGLNTENTGKDVNCNSHEASPMVSHNIKRSAGNATTLVIRNLLYSVTVKSVVEALNDAGYEAVYDFVYVPRKARERKNLGFAFVNFVNAQVADKFTTHWHRNRWNGVSSGRQTLNISAADLQGREPYEKMASSNKKCFVRNAYLRETPTNSSSSASSECRNSRGVEI